MVVNKIVGSSLRLNAQLTFGVCHVGRVLAPCRSMKLKELSYLHAEGYSGGALKHGPFALIEGEEGKYGATPVRIICALLY